MRGQKGIQLFTNRFRSLRSVFSEHVRITPIIPVITSRVLPLETGNSSLTGVIGVRELRLIYTNGRHKVVNSFVIRADVSPLLRNSWKKEHPNMLLRNVTFMRDTWTYSTLRISTGMYTHRYIGTSTPRIRYIYSRKILAVVGLIPQESRLGFISDRVFWDARYITGDHSFHNWSLRVI